MKKTFLILIIYTNIGFYNCSNKHEKKSEDVIATINGSNIYYSEIDQQAKQEIFDQLYRIYYIRKITLEYSINNKILELEAKKKKISEKKLLEEYYSNNMSEQKLESFKIRNEWIKTVPNYKRRSIENLNINTKEGYELLITKYKHELKKKYLDSLKLTYNIEIRLDEPTSPYINTNNLNIHYRGNLKSDVTFIEFSDFECDACKSNSKVFDELYNKYQNKVKFGFCNFVQSPTLSAIAAECAAKQNKFWEFHDKLFKLDKLPDTSQLFQIAKQLQLDEIKFSQDLKKEEIKNRIKDDLDLISKYGLFATPTILINNRMVFNSSSLEEIENILIEQINKAN